jgi:hypothetical protein
VVDLFCIASLWYLVMTLVKLARHGRNPVRISVTSTALTVEDGTLGQMPEVIKLPERMSVVVRQSLPTLTLGRWVDMKFDAIGNHIFVQFYTRQWKLGRELKSLIAMELKRHES